MAPKPELRNTDIGELWRRYKPLEGRDDHADLILALIRKLILQGARDVAYGSWRDKHRTRCGRMEFLRPNGIPEI